MTKQQTTAQVRTINLADADRLRELNKQDRLVQREAKAKPQITISGTFPIAKRWNAKDVKKEVVEGGLTVNAAVVEDIRVKWIIANVDGEKVYLKNEGASGTVTYTVA